MKIIKYELYQSTLESGKVITIPKEVPWSEKNEENAKVEAYNGYTIEDDGQTSYPVAPHNILKGEYVTIGGTLYLASQNIPSGEPVIAGQNAFATTVEEQLLMMKGE